MTPKPPKKSPKKSSKSPPRRRSSATPQPAPIPHTPRHSIPLNFLLRALSTPPRPPSHHPFLRAFSTPLRRRSEYSPLVRRLCQQGAYERVPYDNDDFAKKILPCNRCQNAGRMTQNIAFKQGHAGEWVRVCRTPGCGLICYPAQPGTPPDLLQEIEAAREADDWSLTMATPDSHTSRSSVFVSSTPSQDLNITPSLGGEFEDWLSPLFRDLDMELATHASIISESQSPEPVAGPSTGPGLSALRSAPPQCTRDEEIARLLQDALLLQQLEEGPSPDVSPKVSDRGREPTTLSSLATELAAITGTQSLQTEALRAAARPSVHNSPLRCSSPESSPSPRPRKKKKRMLVKPSPTPPPVKRKIYGPMPPAPSAKSRTKAKTSAGNTKLAKSGAAVPNAKPPSEKRVKPSAKPSIVIVISSDDECAPPTRPADGADGSDVIDITSSESDGESPPPATQPQTPRSRPGPRSTASAPRGSQPQTPRPRAEPRSVRVPLAPPTRHADGGDGSDVINITSSESEGDSPPPATQPRPASWRAVIRSRAPSREVKRPSHSHSEDDHAPPATQPRTAPSRAGMTSCSLQNDTRSLPAIVNELQDAIEAGSSNKENDAPNATHSCLDFRRSIPLSARQAAARRCVGVFASLAKSSSSSSLSSSSSSSSELDDDAHHISDAADRPVPPVRSSAENAGERVDATEAFGDPFRFELYPAVPELATDINPDVEKRHWVLTVKIWYKNNMPPCTKMIALDHASCSIRLSDFFLIARVFLSTGITNFRIWNQFTTDWDARSLYEYLAVSISDNHTLLIRLPTVATLSSWAENVCQAYAPARDTAPHAWQQWCRGTTVVTLTGYGWRTVSWSTPSGVFAEPTGPDLPHLDDLERFLRMHMARTDNILEILLRIVRGDRSTFIPQNAPIAPHLKSAPFRAVS
ncbi:hypothetical protein LXA43DRAFT_1096243 [Ganoderma leucocontextum]|nr:hypothetical protein LXA43DRAFT_1096243 [Ganoderma leucocontextum]